MHRKHVLAYLLFSLFLFLVSVSCYLPSSGGLSKLASEGKYDELLEKTAAMLAKDLKAEPLYYRSIALQQREEALEAFHVLHLYFAMAKEDDQHLVGAHRKMCSLALEANKPQMAISSARWLEERNLLEEADARPYYQGLLQVGDRSEATRVFSHYLKDTIEPYAYAEMLLITPLSGEKLVLAFSNLSHQEQLSLLQSAASDSLNLERATLLLSLATPLEQVFEGSPELRQVYRLLAILYGYADLRVQGRKYSSLAQNFI